VIGFKNEGDDLERICQKGVTQPAQEERGEGLLSCSRAANSLIWDELEETIYNQRWRPGIELTVRRMQSSGITGEKYFMTPQGGVVYIQRKGKRAGHRYATMEEKEDKENTKTYKALIHSAPERKRKNEERHSFHLLSREKSVGGNCHVPRATKKRKKEGPSLSR